MSKSTLTLNDLDWVHTPQGDRLHYAMLTDEQDAELNEYTRVEDAELLCGLTGTVLIPGPFSRMTMLRCKRCCDALGYPRGSGSLKNDHAIRKILGL